jgi:hypothetical protein
MSPDTNKNQQNQTTETKNRVDPSAQKQNETEITTETKLSNQMKRVDPNINIENLNLDYHNENGTLLKRDEESLHTNQVDPKTNSTENQTETTKTEKIYHQIETQPKFFQTEQNKPIENNNLDNIETKRNLTIDELAQAEAVELFEKNKNNPCFLCKNFIESIFKNRKGRKASQAKNCKKCDHAVKGKPNFYK